MTTRSFAIAALLATATTTPAAAQEIAGSAERTPHRIEGRVGWLVGGSDVGDADGFAMGVSAGLGYRIGDLMLRARLDYYRAGDGGDEVMGRKGRATRVGGSLRYSLANAGVDSLDSNRGGIRADFWGEVGAGLEHVAWRHGGVLDRPSGEVALGFDFDGFGRRDARGRRRHGGYFMAFRNFLGRGPEMEGPATCGGPCTRATRPSRLDVSIFFELGLHWGRSH